MAPLLHRYVLPPEAVRVAFWPLHILWVAGATCAVGLLFTTTVVLAVPLHPEPLVTVTEYDVAVVGDTVILCAVALLLQLYEVPAEAVSVTLLPKQMAGLAGVITGTRLALTVTLLWAVAVQLAALVTVTV